VAATPRGLSLHASPAERSDDGKESSRRQRTHRGGKSRSMAADAHPPGSRDRQFQPDVIVGRIPLRATLTLFPDRPILRPSAMVRGPARGRAQEPRRRPQSPRPVPAC
jgi:hypothetical protein